MSDSTPTHYITKTVIGIQNELIAFSPLSYNPDLTTTINSKHGVKADIAPSVKPVPLYFSVGNDGFRNIDDTNLSAPIKPKMTNMDLHNPIPLRCVPVDEDLTPEERALYRMRVRKTINGSDYWCYYFGLITFTDDTVQTTQTDPDSQAEIDYVLDPSNLNPVPTSPTAEGVVNTTGSEVNVALNCTIVVTGSEYFEAIGAIYGDTRYANISEIGIYTGVDQVVSGLDYEDATINYTEAICAQLAVHYCAIGTPLLTSAADFRRTIKLGKGNAMLL